MTVYQCFFFANDFIRDWENIECPDVNLPAVLRSRLSNRKLIAGEAWLGETLVCRIEGDAVDSPVLGKRNGQSAARSNPMLAALSRSGARSINDGTTTRRVPALWRITVGRGHGPLEVDGARNGADGAA